MTDGINFFASVKDLCIIFESIEKEFDIKYCANYVYVEAEDNEMPDIEFNTIGEIADNYGESYYIVQKTQYMHTVCQVLQDKERVRYNTRCDGHNCLTFKSKEKNSNGYEGDYEVHIPRQYETEFTGALFKRIVREVKRNCVKVKAISPFYVSNELYKNKENYVFYGMRFAFPKFVTETGEAKRWWTNPNVREFMDRPIAEHLQYLKDIFANKELQDLNYENRTEQYEIYEGVLYKLSLNKDLTIIKDIAVLFDDNVNIVSPLYITKSIMEELKDIIIELAYFHKREGFKVLLENLKSIPNAGYDCGKKELIITLFKKKYYETFKESLSDVTEDTKIQIKEILGNISNKRLQGQVNEIIGLL